MKTIAHCLLVPAFVLATSGLAAQTPEQHAERLAWFSGYWTFNDAPGGSQCEMLGEYIVHCMTESEDASGNEVRVAFIVQYDQEDETYRAYRFYSSGYADSGLGWVDGNTWTFVYEGREGARFKFTGVSSPDSWQFQWHRSTQGGPWEATSNGSMTRVR